MTTQEHIDEFSEALKIILNAEIKRGNEIIETPQNLSYILEVEFKVNPNIAKGTTSILEIKYSNEDKARIKTILEDVKNFIITKYENDTSFYKNKIMTKQIGDIKISEEAINDKKDLILTVTFITGFIFSIFFILTNILLFYCLTKCNSISLK